jgi:hypothetical protein
MIPIHHSARRVATALAVALVLAAPAVPAQTPAVVLPKSDCGAKPDHPGKLASDNQKRQWRRDANTYLECFKKYASDQRETAQKYQEAANKAIDEYNAAVKDMQAQIDAAAQ